MRVSTDNFAEPLSPYRFTGTAIRTVRPLTREAADNMGHVIWIDNRDPLKAYEQMFDGLNEGLFNCAVWANAGDQINPDDLTALKNWRRHSKILEPFVDPACDIWNDKTSCMAKYFNGLSSRNAAPDLQPVLFFLRRQAQLQADLIQAATPIERFVYTLRGIKSTNAGDFNKVAHTDNSGFGKKSYSLRVLQSLASPSTCIINNKNARPFYAESQAVSDALPNKYELNPDVPATIWQAPENSVVIITNSMYAGQPVLHCEAPTIEKRPQPRTVGVFDLRLAR